MFTLTGPESLSYANVAARISAVFARHVRYSDLPEDRALEELLGSGMAPWDAEGMLELFAWIRAGGAGQLTSHVREVTRHAPRGLTDWLEGARAITPANARTSRESRGSPARILMGSLSRRIGEPSSVATSERAAAVLLGGSAIRAG